MSRGSIGLSPLLNDYVVGAHGEEHPVLERLRVLTGRMRNGGMQVAPEQGRFLAFLVRLTGARRTLEIGTFTGYSALATALALPAEGKVVALDVSEEWTAIGRRHWAEAGVADKIDLRIGPALETLAELLAGGEAGEFDFAFVDAHKPEYDGYYEACLKLVRVGGLIVFDNMLQAGKVVDPSTSDDGVMAIRALNAKIAVDDRVEAVLLPVGDGMTLARRLR